MSTYAYDQLVRAFREARETIRHDAETHPAAPPGTHAHMGQGVDVVAYALAKILADGDPKFDPEAFRKAVGM